MQRPGESTYFRYPGSGHILRYLRLACDGSQNGVVEGLMPALADLTDGSGVIRLGALGLLIDYAAGMLALQTVQPDWTVTHDLSLHLTGLAPPEGELESTTRVVRAGKTSVISETWVHTPGGVEVARGQVTFTRVARREGTPGASSKLLVNLAEPEANEAPRRPLDEAVGFRFSPAPSDKAGHHFIEFQHRQR